MLIAGYEPLTLIDYPGQVAAIVFTQGCPFRCVYCHNPELLPNTTPNPLSEEEILDKLKTDKLMLDGVVITGGEPTVQPDLLNFLQKIKQLGLKIKLDTNGVHPRVIEQCLKNNVVDFLAMDIKQRFENYTDIIGQIGQAAINNCQTTMKIIQNSNITHEWRTTIYSALHTEDDILTIASYLLPGETYALQEIRYTKTLTPNLTQVAGLDLSKLKAKINTLYPKLNVLIKNTL